ncbi:MAG: hypothetical protein Q9180_008751, partial [Flavoplaca navasiana]
PDNPTKIPNSNIAFSHDLPSQLIYKPPFPSTSFANKTIPFAGANTGLGREAATNLVRLGAAKVILAVRPHPKNDAQGEVAKSAIGTTTGVTGVFEMYDLDYPSSASVLVFAAQ